MLQKSDSIVVYFRLYPGYWVYRIESFGAKPEQFISQKLALNTAQTFYQSNANFDSLIQFNQTPSYYSYSEMSTNCFDFHIENLLARSKKLFIYIETMFGIQTDDLTISKVNNSAIQYSNNTHFLLRPEKNFTVELNKLMKNAAYGEERKNIFREMRRFTIQEILNFPWNTKENSSKQNNPGIFQNFMVQAVLLFGVVLILVVLSFRFNSKWF